MYGACDKPVKLIIRPFGDMQTFPYYMIHQNSLL